MTIRGSTGCSGSVQPVGHPIIQSLKAGFEERCPSGGFSPFSKITRHRREDTGRAGVQPTAASRFHINTHAFAAFHSPVWVAAHDLGNPAGRAAAVGIDRNRDGNINGKDYAPGQFAAEAAAVDINSNGWTNGQDYAPGQLPLHSDA